MFERAPTATRQDLDRHAIPAAKVSSVQDWPVTAVVCDSTLEVHLSRRLCPVLQKRRRALGSDGNALLQPGEAPFLAVAVVFAASGASV